MPATTFQPSDPTVGKRGPRLGTRVQTQASYTCCSSDDQLHTMTSPRSSTSLMERGLSKALDSTCNRGRDESSHGSQHMSVCLCQKWTVTYVLVQFCLGRRSSLDNSLSVNPLAAQNNPKACALSESHEVYIGFMGSTRSPSRLSCSGVLR